MINEDVIFISESFVILLSIAYFFEELQALSVTLNLFDDISSFSGIEAWSFERATLTLQPPSEFLDHFFNLVITNKKYAFSSHFLSLIFIPLTFSHQKIDMSSSLLLRLRWSIFPQLTKWFRCSIYLFITSFEFFCDFLMYWSHKFP